MPDLRPGAGFGQHSFSRREPWRYLCVFHRHFGRCIRTASRQSDAQLCRKFRPHSICLYPRASSRSRFCQCFPSGRHAVELVSRRRGAHRHPHGPCHRLDRFALVAGHDGRALRSHHQHPRPGCRTANPQATRTARFGSRTQLRRDLSARHGRRNPGIHRGARLAHPTRKVERNRKRQHPLHCLVPGV